MNAGKSTALLQSNYNYQERGMETLLFLPEVDAASSNNEIHSRIGLTAIAHSVSTDFNFYNFGNYIFFKIFNHFGIIET